MRAESDVPIVMLTARRRNGQYHRAGTRGRQLRRQTVQPARTARPHRAVLRRAGDKPWPTHRTRRPPPCALPGGAPLEPARRRLLNPEAAPKFTLTGGEYDLLLALVERANRVLTRDMLLDLLRGRQAGPFDRAIDVAISRLRRKLEDDGRNAQLIKTVRGGGYVLAATVERL